ncbi:MULTISPECIES: protein phosphatase 2C domain-containing protein [unclassified Streptomyces]|uniref:protein phosphatase 2C domain-containing protein n=1 Tax=unclassified Streptomyces TaxID=2593676 RepID=UPI002349F6CB|nr:protein phosphatase 2C domain-containing protein [Streptomyces sp. M92]WCN03961.1 protein phosphatase 2C domain-containing protein [Streptomyces sp. M92]
MSQQGGSPAGHDDDWWAQLYDDSADDTGPTTAPDSLDDRFTSAAGTVARGPDHGTRGGPTPPPPTPAPVGVPAPRTGPPSPAGTTSGHPGPPPPRAPWEPPPAIPTGPVSFPAGRQGGQPAPPSPRSDRPGPPLPPPGGGRRVWTRGRTTSGTGDADLSEPAAGGSAPPPPAGDAPVLPPLPPPFLPSAPPAPAGPDYVGSGPPTYDPEPTALPPADPEGLDGLVADTVLDGARYGNCTLRAVSVRGDSARYRGEPRRDALLVARFGAGEQALVLVAMATGARASAGAHRAAAEVCRWIGRAVGRSHDRLGQDLRAGRRGELKSGLHRLTDRSLGRLRAGAADQGLSPDEYAATLRCLLLPADPECRTRVYFGVGAGGLLRLRDGAWQNMEPSAGEVAGEPVVGFGSPPAETPEGDRLTMDLGVTAPPGPHHDPPAGPPREPFRFRASVARPGDVLLMCTAGLAEPLLSEPELGTLLARRWSGRTPPGLAEFLADSGVRVKGYADDRTAAAVWEA